MLVKVSELSREVEPYVHMFNIIASFYNRTLLEEDEPPILVYYVTSSLLLFLLRRIYMTVTREALRTVFPSITFIDPELYLIVSDEDNPSSARYEKEIVMKNHVYDNDLIIALPFTCILSENANLHIYPTTLANAKGIAITSLVIPSGVLELPIIRIRSRITCKITSEDLLKHYITINVIETSNNFDTYLLKMSNLLDKAISETIHKEVNYCKNSNIIDLLDDITYMLEKDEKLLKFLQYVVKNYEQSLIARVLEHRYPIPYIFDRLTCPNEDRFRGIKDNTRILAYYYLLK